MTLLPVSPYASQTFEYSNEFLNGAKLKLELTQFILFKLSANELNMFIFSPIIIPMIVPSFEDILLQRTVLKTMSMLIPEDRERNNRWACLCISSSVPKTSVRGRYYNLLFILKILMLGLGKVNDI